MPPLTNVQVVPSYLGAGNNIAAGNGTITHTSQYTEIIVPLTQAPQVDGTFSISGTEANNHVAYPSMKYEGGGQQRAQFMDNPQ